MTQNVYFWSGLDAGGNRIQGCDRAVSIPVLKYNLLKQKIICSQVKKQNLLFIGFRRWVNSKSSIFFLTQLAAMLKTGINMNKAIAILKDHQHDKLIARVYEDISRRLNTGASLSSTLGNYPVLFDNVTLHLIESGEFSGQIDKAVTQAGEYLEQKSKTSNDVLTAILYPVILTIVTLGVLMIMIYFVIPQFETLYTGSNEPLPLLTNAVLSISNLIRTNLSALLSIIMFAILFGKLVCRRTRFDFTRMIPKLNRAIVRINTLRLCQTLNNMYYCGVSLADALILCKNLSASHRYQQAITQTVQKIHQGVELSQALQESAYFEPIFIQLIRTGEQTADLGNMLNQCALFYQKQLGDTLARLKIILEPLLIVVLGTIIGIILMAMYLPVFKIGSSF